MHSFGSSIRSLFDMKRTYAPVSDIMYDAMHEQRQDSGGPHMSLGGCSGSVI
jgi:hypothetical protein